MRTPLRLVTSALLPLVLGAPAWAQAQPAAKPAAPRPAAPRIPNADEVLATVNGAKITRGQLINFLSQYSFPPGREKDVYDAAIDAMVNLEVLKQFLDRNRVGIAEKEVEGEVEKVRQQLQKQGSGDLETTLNDLNITQAELRDRLGMSLRWAAYFKSQANDATLQQFFEKNKDLINGTQVKASHILVKLPEKATDEQKAAARDKLAALKKQIDDGKISFAAAANTYSEDDGNKLTPDGGNLDYFTRRGQYIDGFCDAAFALPTGKVSDPVETEYGYHLILVTDRKEGRPIDFKQARDAVLDLFGFDLRAKVLKDERAKAKIEIKPMPANIFPQVQQGQPAAAPAAAPARPAPAGNNPAPAPPAAPRADAKKAG